MASSRKPSVSGPVERNIRSIARMEQMHEDRMTVMERAASTIATLAGSNPSVLLHICAIAAWLLINTGHVSSIHPFDPYPFSLFSMIISSEGVLLTVLVLFKQNAAQRRDEHMEQLNLQVDLLTEKEVTKALQLLRAVCIKLDIPEPLEDGELSEMSQVTSVGTLAERILEDLPPRT